MTDQQSKLCSPRTGNLTTFFFERAKHYRFAAAMTENTHEIERLCEVAHMFERMAHDTRRLAPHSRLTAAAWPKRHLSTDRKAGFIKTWVDSVLGRVTAVAVAAPLTSSNVSAGFRGLLHHEVHRNEDEAVDINANSSKP
jgi:hypothetical protein